MIQEEKLEEAKRLYETANADQKYVLERLFPELRESEDERIRKEIHIYLDWLDDRNKDYQPKGEYSIRDMIAWLEKQGQTFTKKDVDDAYLKGAQWQKEQFENNRLAACERQTQEEAQRESDFVIGIIEKEHRQPTFSDAIEYGRNTILSALEKIVKSKEEKNRDYVFAFSEIKELIERLK